MCVSIRWSYILTWLERLAEKQQDNVSGNRREAEMRGKSEKLITNCWEARFFLVLLPDGKVRMREGESEGELDRRKKVWAYLSGQASARSPQTDSGWRMYRGRRLSHLAEWLRGGENERVLGGGKKIKWMKKKKFRTKLRKHGNEKGLETGSARNGSKSQPELTD